MVQHHWTSFIYQAGFTYEFIRTVFVFILVKDVQVVHLHKSVACDPMTSRLRVRAIRFLFVDAEVKFNKPKNK